MAIQKILHCTYSSLSPPATLCPPLLLYGSTLPSYLPPSIFLFPYQTLSPPSMRGACSCLVIGSYLGVSSKCNKHNICMCFIGCIMEIYNTKKLETISQISTCKYSYLNRSIAQILYRSEYSPKRSGYFRILRFS